MVKSLDIYFMKDGVQESVPAATLVPGNAISLAEKLKQGVGMRMYGQFSDDGQTYGDIIEMGAPIGLAYGLSVAYEADGLAKVLLNGNEATVTQTSELSLSTGKAIRFEYRD